MAEKYPKFVEKKISLEIYETDIYFIYGEVPENHVSEFKNLQDFYDGKHIEDSRETYKAACWRNIAPEPKKIDGHVVYMSDRSLYILSHEVHHLYEYIKEALDLGIIYRKDLEYEACLYSFIFKKCMECLPFRMWKP